MTKATSSKLVNARRDAVVLAVLIVAVMMLIWNGSTFFHNLPMGDAAMGPEIRLASTALTLNVALILFGWRRYVDLQHEAEMRAEHERRAVVLATTDAITALYNRKGFADHAGQLARDAGERGENLVVVSFQIHRFKAINDHHGYETGDRLLNTLSGSLAGDARATDAALAAAGVIVCEDLDRLLETAELVAGCRRMGRRVGRGRTGVVTVSTGEASLIADLVPRTGIDLPDVPPTARAALLAALPTLGYIGNPLDPWGATDPPTAFRISRKLNS